MFLSKSLDLICTTLPDDKRGPKKSPGSHREVKSRKKSAGRRKDESNRSRSPQNASNPYDADESDSEELPSGYHQVYIQVCTHTFDTELVLCTKQELHSLSPSHPDIESNEFL